MAKPSLPPLRLLTVFETVLRRGGIQKAAADLNVTQPAVSQALKALEAHVGMELFDRRTRPAALTEAGRILERGVTEGLALIAEAIVRIGQLRGAAEGSVTIACSVGTATYWLMPRLADFYQTHPDIAVNVTTTIGAPDLLPGVDLAIRYGRGEWRDGAVIKLFDERVMPVCSPALVAQLEAEGGLAAAELLHVVSDERTWLGWSDYLELAGLPPNRSRGRFFTNYVQATQAALSGQGVMLGWESNAGDLVREGRLSTIAAPAVVPEEAFYLVLPDLARERQVTRIVTDWIVTAASR